MPIIVPPDTANTAALIISFNPDERILLLVKQLKYQKLKIFIIDNATDVANNALNQLSSDQDVFLSRNQKNLGIGSALNLGISEIIKAGYHWVLQFDQDSIPKNNFFERIIGHWTINPAKPVLLGCGRGSDIGVSISHYSDSCSVITSGSLLNLNVFSIVGPYRADFFIDGVDFEYALRLKSLGFATGNTGYAVIDHQLGELQNENHGVSWLQPTHHNSLRRYYRSRNLMIISRLYFFRFPLFVLKYHFFHFISVVVLIFRDQDRLAKLKSVFKGFRDGLFYRK